MAWNDTDMPLRPTPAAEIRRAAAGGDDDAMIRLLCGSSVDSAEIPTRVVSIARGVLSEVGTSVRSLMGSACRAAVVMDANTRAAAGQTVLDQLDGAIAIELAPLDGWDHLTPHEALAGQIIERCGGGDCLIAIGSGTVNDLTKYAADRLSCPYVAVPTAASMNGYTSSIAAIISDGLKRTLPSRPPAAVLADVDVMASAPADMARSGYADLLSKPMSTADWRLAWWVIDEPFSDLPGVVVSSVIGRCLDAAGQIAASEPDAVALLCRALVLSGFSMTLAGTSAPASGAEHLISHYWDMSAYAATLAPPGSHGFQVALGTLMTAHLYELMRTCEPGRFCPRHADPQAMAAAHGQLWPAIRAQAEAQILTPAQGGARLDRIRDRWDDMWRDLDAIRRSADQIRCDLIRGGVPITPIACGIDDQRARHALLHAADIRNRYTILHLARDCGMLESLAGQIL